MNRYLASNLFWVTNAIGLILTLGFAASGPLLAHFFRNPLVTRVTIGISIAIFIGGAETIHLALLRRAMRFASLSANDVVALLAYTGTATLLALRGWGYWALVAAILAQALSGTIGAFWLCRWVPSLPRRGVGTRAVLAFAFKVYGRFSASYFTKNFDNLLVGWRFNAVALGYYKKAYDLFALTASQLTAPLDNVALSALSRLTHEPDRFKRYLGNSLGIIAFVGMAVGADLTLVGRDLVRLVLGPKWGDSGRIFELFGPGIGVMLLCSTVGWIHLSIGKPGRWLRWAVVEAVGTGLSFVVALRWGPSGIAAAWSLSYWTMLVPSFWYAGRPIGFGVSSLISAVWRYCAAALLGGLATAGILRNTPFWGTPLGFEAALRAVVLGSALFVALYVGTVILLHGSLEPLHRLVRLGRELAPSRKAAKPAVEPV